MSVKTLAEYDAKEEIKIRENAYNYYPITEFPIDKIELEPTVLSVPFEISENTLNMIDSSAENFKKGIVSEPIDLSEFEN